MTEPREPRDAWDQVAAEELEHLQYLAGQQDRDQQARREETPR
ncbi:hypothetical protein F4561_002607 [Lipingzhangella halophila]|uniref:Uncharacterized protein n=1 Tax=Lipingzhangella halophila TaxID=1783352 RepID=A0A7W7RGY9_9ACTN|nr:hypothetical protein [Lipingzhangella halophila]MBB4931787.1 hypothetical protein [Lipingzhangella halophila]